VISSSEGDKGAGEGLVRRWVRVNGMRATCCSDDLLKSGRKIVRVSIQYRRLKANQCSSRWIRFPVQHSSHFYSSH
jgi:hypothetical protein